MCEIRRHNTEQSCWLVAGDTIYDATSYISQHPGGATSILKKSGGVADCSEDLMFHSKNGRKVWKKYVVGKVKKCPGPDGSLQGDVDKHWWMFWA
jgi:cytochrome b involved in lipid metabolism